jgi:hypothetical protein
MKKAKIEIIRYKRECAEIVIEVPDDMILNLSSIRGIAQDALEQNLINENNWNTESVEFAGASLVKNETEEEATIAVAIE